MRQNFDKAGGPARHRGKLGDFTADRRVLLLIGMAFVVGSGGAAAAWLLIKLIAFVTNLVWFGRIGVENTPLAETTRGALWMVLAPAVGGLVIGLMARYGSEKIRGHGIPEAIEAILIGGSRMQPKVAVLKPLSSAISIGSGGPFGAEGPIIMTGGAIGSLFAQCFHLTAAERKTLLVAGAAAGMTAIFGTPIAAVLLAVELLLFEWKPRSFLPVVAAAVISAVWRPFLFDKGPLFPFDAHPVLPWWGIAAAIVVGVVAGLQSGLMTRLLYAAEDLFDHVPLHWMWWPALGGLAVGLGGVIDPHALGVGYDVIADLLSGHATASEVTRLLLVKSAIWLIALASGTSGGVLAPLLILGGSAGWLEGQMLPGGASYWALIGMAAMMGGTMRSPLTGVMFAIELTGNVDMLLPLLAATGAAHAVTVLLLKRSILTEKIARRGQHITREYSIDPFELLRVSEVMVKRVDTLPVTMPVDDAVAFFSADADRHKSYPVVTADGRLAGMVARADVLRWRTEGEHQATTLDDFISDTSTVSTYPDEVLARAADLMVSADLGRIPVVDRNSQRVVGLIARKDLLRIRSVVRAQEQDRKAYFMREKAA
ncbi:chloride channel protein [Bradyrhizobium tropiciagri]|uniref:chloride channel protein n=1 Tax=Bradyrhizobium tropiciagri TaxID=312253 RepID=UPI001BAA85FC|nr:chloride channel protein [Bradyrhizobium tropiciagri]MBR0870851.1 chloride channel protein [Bradyrhizobium tropiciagri]